VQTGPPKRPSIRAEVTPVLTASDPELRNNRVSFPLFIGSVTQ